MIGGISRRLLHKNDTFEIVMLRHVIAKSFELLHKKVPFRVRIVVRLGIQ